VWETPTGPFRGVGGGVQCLSCCLTNSVVGAGPAREEPCVIEVGVQSLPCVGEGGGCSVFIVV